MEPRDLSAHVAYEAGRGVEEVAQELGVDPDELVILSSNENALGPSPAAVAAIRQHATRIHRYPKAAHTDLTAALADRWEVNHRQVWLANGGDGVLDYLGRALIEPGDAVLVPRPGFAYYGMSARYHHGSVRSYELRADDGFAQTPEAILRAYDDERIVYITSPHNPTGSEMTPEAVAEIAEGTADHTLVLVDEAYAEFSDGASAVELVGTRDDVAVLRTFSKAYGLAGLRLGYGLMPAEWADAYTRVTTPFAASEIACRAGLAALEDTDHLDRSVRTAHRSRERLRMDLDGRTWPSGGNFVLADVGDATAVARAAQERGVVVRDCTSFGLPGCVRVTCGTDSETREAVSVLNEVTAE